MLFRSNNSINSLTASSINFVPATSSYASSASYAPTNITTSWAQSSSNAINSQTASSLVTTNNYVINNLSASLITGSQIFLTTNNSYPLEISSSGAPSMIALRRASATNANIFYQNNSTSVYAGLIPAGGFGISTIQDLSNPTFAVKFTGANSASVGINVSVPVNALDVGGNISASAVTASTFFGTSSWANSASNAIASQTASFLPVATYNITSSWSTNSLTASSINFTASNATLAQTASYITTSNVVGTVTSASYALSASYAPGEIGRAHV